MSMAITDTIVKPSVHTPTNLKPTRGNILFLIKELIFSLEHGQPSDPEYQYRTDPVTLRQSLASLLNQNPLTAHLTTPSNLDDLYQFEKHLLDIFPMAVAESTDPKAVNPEWLKEAVATHKASQESNQSKPSSTPSLKEQNALIEKRSRDLAASISQNLRGELQAKGVNQILAEDFTITYWPQIYEGAYIAGLQNTDLQTTINQALETIASTSQAANSLIKLVDVSAQSKVHQSYKPHYTPPPPSISSTQISHETQASLSPYYPPTVAQNQAAIAQKIIEASILVGQTPHTPEDVARILEHPQSHFPKVVAEDRRFQETLVAHANNVVAALPDTLNQLSKQSLTTTITHELSSHNVPLEKAASQAEQIVRLITPPQNSSTSFTPPPTPTITPTGGITHSGTILSASTLTLEQAAIQILGPNSQETTSLLNNPEVIHTNHIFQQFFSPTSTATSPQSAATFVSQQLITSPINTSMSGITGVDRIYRTLSLSPAEGPFALVQFSQLTPTDFTLSTPESLPQHLLQTTTSLKQLELYFKAHPSNTSPNLNDPYNSSLNLSRNWAPPPPLRNRLLGISIDSSPFAPQPNFFARVKLFFSSPSGSAFGQIFNPAPIQYIGESLPAIQPRVGIWQSMKNFFSNPFGVFGGGAGSETLGGGALSGISTPSLGADLLGGAGGAASTTSSPLTGGGLGNLLRSLGGGAMKGLGALGQKALPVAGRLLAGLTTISIPAWPIIIAIVCVFALSLLMSSSSPVSHLGIVLNEQTPVVGAGGGMGYSTPIILCTPDEPQCPTSLCPNCTGPMKCGVVTQCPKSNGSHRNANAIDIAFGGICSIDKQGVYSPVAGKVIEVVNNYRDGSGYFGNAAGYANLVRVRFQDPQTQRYFILIFAHLSQQIYVTSGQDVSANELLAVADHTGNSSGPHLHFELKAEDGGPMPSIATLYPSSGCQ